MTELSLTIRLPALPSLLGAEGSSATLPPLPVAFGESVDSVKGFRRIGCQSDALQGPRWLGEPLPPGQKGYALVPESAQVWLEVLDGRRRAPELRDALLRYAHVGEHSWDIGPEQSLPLNRPLVMGIVNVTPDSFSDGGLYLASERAIAHGLSLVEAGADILDIGGESTRPGAEAVGEEAELQRVLPVIRGLIDKVAVPVSIDTRKAVVARAAVEAGASIVNDVSAFRDDPRMAATVAELDVGAVLMHKRGQPETMQDNTRYEDLFGEVARQLEQSLRLAYDAGIDLRRILVDPGIGFGKRLGQNLDLIAYIDRLWALGRPQLLGASRKRFIGELTDKPAPERVYGTLAAHTAGILAGAAVIRVHDVSPARDAALVAGALHKRYSLSLHHPVTL